MMNLTVPMNDHHLPDRSEASQEFYKALDQLKNLLESDDSQESSSAKSPEEQTGSAPKNPEKELNWDEVAADLEDIPE